jgi:hypothetical protein
MGRLAARAFLNGDIELKTNQLLSDELHKLLASYRGGTSDLARLSQRAETLIEEIRPHLSTDTFSQAMNCVYLIEEINALVLDESRRVTDSEQHEIHTQLTILESILATK